MTASMIVIGQSFLMLSETRQIGMMKAIGADAYCRDAAVAVETAKAMIARKHNQMAAG